MSFIRSFLSVSGLTLVSRVLGLVRDVIIAAVFGAGAVTDAFFTAFRLPNTLRRFTAEGALTQAFVPVYRQRHQQSPEAAGQVAGEAAAFLFVVLLVFSVACLFFAPWIVYVLAPGLPERATAADLLRIVFPYLLFISLASLATGMLNAVGRFFAAAAIPVFLNLSMIGAALILAPHFDRPIFALAWGVFLGGLVQLLWAGFFVWSARLLPARWPLRFPPSAEVKRVLRLLGYGAMGAGAAQINLLINLFIASFLAAGSLSWLYYADRLMELPAGLLGAALTTVVLPGLSSAVNDSRVFSALIDSMLKIIVLLALPAALGLVLLAQPLVATLFFHGAFDAHDAAMTEKAVLAYGLGVGGLVAVRPLAAVFFARQQANVPVRSAFAALVATQLFNAVFVWGLGMGHVGLALSVGLAAWLNAGILLVVLCRRGWYRPTGGWKKLSWAVLTALAVMAGVLLWMSSPSAFSPEVAPFQRGASLLACVAVAMAAYFLTVRLFGLRVADFRPSVPL